MNNFFTPAAALADAPVRPDAAPLSGQKPLLCREVVFLLVICLLDTLSSAWLFHHNMATEANPILRPAAEAGVGQFMLAKMLAFVPQLMVAEWYRRWRPEVALPLLRWVGALYVGIYALLVAAQFVNR